MLFNISFPTHYIVPLLHSILDLDPEKSLKSQLAPAEGDDGVPLKDDPKYVKYYKMMKMGLPKEAVQHAMTRDQMDPRYVLCLVSVVDPRLLMWHVCTLTHPLPYLPVAFWI